MFSISQLKWKIQSWENLNKNCEQGVGRHIESVNSILKWSCNIFWLITVGYATFQNNKNLSSTKQTDSKHNNTVCIS